MPSTPKKSEFNTFCQSSSPWLNTGHGARSGMEGKCFPKRNLDVKELKDGTFAICLLAKQAVIYLGDKIRRFCEHDIKTSAIVTSLVGGEKAWVPTLKAES